MNLSSTCICMILLQTSFSPLLDSSEPFKIRNEQQKCISITLDHIVSRALFAKLVRQLDRAQIMD